MENVQESLGVGVAPLPGEGMGLRDESLRFDEIKGRWVPLVGLARVVRKIGDGEFFATKRQLDHPIRAGAKATGFALYHFASLVAGGVAFNYAFVPVGLYVARSLSE